MEGLARLPVWAVRPAWVDDVLLAAGMAVFGDSGTLGTVDNQPISRPPGVLGRGLLLVASVTVAFRRRHPIDLPAGRGSNSLLPPGQRVGASVQAWR
jgi:hypothetical protein